MEKTNKKNRLEVMLDLETMGIGEKAAILEISLVPFCLDAAPVDVEPFHKVIDITSCLLEGMRVEDDTQKWWMKQDAQAKWNLRHSEKTDIRDAIRQSHDWLAALCSGYEVHLWCRGLNFDVPKYERCVRMLLEERTPYDWWNLEDARTYAHTFDVHNADIEFEGIRHSAAADCHHQIRIVQEAYKRKENTKRFALIGILAEAGGDRAEINRMAITAFGKAFTEEQLDQLLA